MSVGNRQDDPHSPNNGAIISSAAWETVSPMICGASAYHCHSISYNCLNKECMRMEAYSKPNFVSWLRKGTVCSCLAWWCLRGERMALWHYWELVPRLCFAICVSDVLMREVIRLASCWHLQIMLLICWCDMTWCASCQCLQRPYDHRNYLFARSRM